MSLNKNIKVKLPDSKWVLSKPNSSGDRYVRYFISSKRVNGKSTNVKRVNIGIYDEKCKMLIPNNKYYEVFGESSLTTFIPSSIRNYGNYYLLYRICSENGLLDTIKEVFPSNWDKIVTMAMYNICESDAMYYIDDYCDENYVINNTYVNAPETSNIFSKIGEKERQEFFKSWIEKRNENECIAYDITSISSYSKEIELLEFGYNRDKENLPQINLGMFYGMNCKLPLIYDIYNGSIGDKVHFESMMKYAKAYDLSNISLIMDRGFYKKENLEYLYKETIPFIMGISLSIKEVKEKLNEKKEDLKLATYVLNGDDTPNGTSIDISINERPYRLHLYYHPYKAADEISIIKNKILKLENELKQLKRITNPSKYEKFFKLKIENETLVSYERDIDKLNEAFSSVGFFALLSSRLDYTTEEILDIYRRKDMIEKTFDNLKNYVDCNRLRVHYTETVKGKIFVIFLSLIIKSVIDNKEKEITVKKVINELKKIKLQILPNGEQYISPLTKKQKEIFKLFNITEEQIKESVRQLPL